MKAVVKAADEITIEGARSDDVVRIQALLRAADLPFNDVAGHVAHFFVARRAGGIVGAVGAEVYGSDALLRSLVVSPSERTVGVGQRLLQQLERAAAGWGVNRWWLLTTTAETYFRKRGFRVTPREEAPHGIAATEQFRGLCPSIAVCLSRETTAS